MADQTTQTAVIDAGEVSAVELVFRMIGQTNDHRYILQADRGEDYLGFMSRFPKYSVRRTTEHYIDDPAGKWFACFNVDCFDPPFAIVRARNLETAYEVFTDEWERWLKVKLVDAGDYPDDDRAYNNQGTHIDTDNVQIHELELLAVSVALED